MNILHISASFREKEGHAFSYHFRKVCQKLGFNVESVSPYDPGFLTDKMDFEINDESYIRYMTGKELFPLSRILRDYPNSDFIFIENPKFPFGNDVEIPVVYYHRDLHCQIYVPNADYLILRFWSFGKAKDGRPSGGQPELVELHRPDVWYDKSVKKIWLCHALSEVEFDGLNKYKYLSRDKKGFAYRGSYKSVREMMKSNNIHFQYYNHHFEIMKLIRENDLAAEFVEVSTGLKAYKKHLFEFDATLIIPGWDAWETRRLYEASYCKCVPILYIQNKNARRVLEAQGYIHGETCICFSSKEELLTLDIYNFDLEKIRENGYNLVLERHTYEKRVLELLRKINCKKIMLKNDLRKILKHVNKNGELKKLIKNLEVLDDRYNSRF